MTEHHGLGGLIHGNLEMVVPAGLVLFLACKYSHVCPRDLFPIPLGALPSGPHLALTVPQGPASKCHPTGGSGFNIRIWGTSAFSRS